MIHVMTLHLHCVMNLCEANDYLEQAGFSLISEKVKFTHLDTHAWTHSINPLTINLKSNSSLQEWGSVATIWYSWIHTTVAASCSYFLLHEACGGAAWTEKCGLVLFSTLPYLEDSERERVPQVVMGGQQHSAVVSVQIHAWQQVQLGVHPVETSVGQVC